MKRTKTPVITFSLLTASENWGVARETIRRGLAVAGIEKDKDFTVQDINAAVYGDNKLARTRKINLESDLLEIEKAVAENRLLEPEVVKERIARRLGVIAEYMRAAEVELPPVTNPSDLEFARKGVVEWTAKFWPLVRGEVAK